MSLHSRLARLVSIIALTTGVAGVVAPPAEGAGYWVDRQLGDLADLKTLRFSGNKTFSDAVLCDYLNVDPHVMSAGHRTAYLKDYIAVLGAQLGIAYRHVGFNDVEVKVDFVEKEKRIDVAIEEGTRYRYGEIRITGNTSVPTAELVEWLTRPTPNEKKTVGLDPDDAERGVQTWIGADGYVAPRVKPEWPTGEIASFSFEKTTTLKSLVRRAYAEHGLLDPKLDVNLVTRASGKAELVVAVSNEGPSATIDEVVVAGGNRNGAKEILKLIDVKPGANFDRELRTRVEQALWRSARFRSYTVTYELGTEGKMVSAHAAPKDKADADKEKNKKDKDEKKQTSAEKTADLTKLVEITPATKSKLYVSVVESLYVPPLGTELSAEQQAMLKFRGWLADCGKRGDDVSLSLAVGDDFGGRIIISPERGWFAEWSLRSKGADGAPQRYAFRSTADKIGLYAVDQGKKFEFVPTESLWNLQVKLVESDDPKQAINFNLGLSTRPPFKGTTDQTLQLRSHVSPNAAVVIGTPKVKGSPDPTKYEVKDGVLQIYGDSLFARIDASTGKLLTARLAGDSLLAEAMHLVAGNRFDVEIRSGLFADRLQKFDTETAQLTNRFDDAKPWQALGNFLLDDIGWDQLDGKVTKDLVQPIRMLRQARDAGLITPLVETFELLTAEEKVPGSTFGDGKVGPARFAELLFPRDSWPWVQTREFGLALQKHSRYTRETLEAGIEKDNWGPLALGFASMAAKKFEFYYLAEPWAEKGKEKIKPDDFARDCQPLAAESHLSGRFLHAFAKFTRALSDEDAAVAIAAAQNAPVAAAFMKALRAEPMLPVEQVLAASLRRSWSKDAQVRLAGLMGMLLK